MALCVLLLGGIYARRVWVSRQASQPSPPSQVLKAFGAGNPAAKVWVNTDSGTYHCPGTRWYGLSPRTCIERAEAFGYKHVAWLGSLPPAASKTLRELAEQFAHGGTDALESPHVFEMSSVRGAGGLAALRVSGNPADVLRQTKERIFAA